MTHLPRLAMLILLPALAAVGETPADLTAEYLARYNKLDPKDIPARLALADWCGSKGLQDLRVQVLTEILWIDPKYDSAYKLLLDADAHRSRPIDKQWAADLQSLLTRDYRLHHTAHFTILTDTPEAIVASLSRALEDTYLAFYKECASIGLRPMPPASRLVCILFSRHAAYSDYLGRIEHVSAGWMSGYYSSRTNRCAFFDDRDNLAFKSVHDELAKIDARIAALKAESLDSATPEPRIAEARQRLSLLNTERNRILTRLDVVSQITTTAKARHEVAHQLFASSGLLDAKRDHPFWLAEGLAMLFETADESGRVSPSRPNPYRLRSYGRAEADSRLMPLGRLLSASIPEDESAQAAADTYAQAWALAHWLWKTHPAELKAYIAALNTAPPPLDAVSHFRRYFGQNLDAVERDLRHHIASLPRGGL